MNLTFKGDFKKTIVIDEEFRAPRKQIYRVWTEPQHLKNWFMADRGFKMIGVRTDLRIGGEYHLDLEFMGNPHWVKGNYKSVTEFENLSYTWLVPLLKGRNTIVNVTFHDNQPGSKIHLEHQVFEDKTEIELHAKGWTNCLESLQEYLDRANLD